MKTDFNELYFGSVTTKFELAHGLYERNRHQLLNDNVLRHELSLLEEGVARLERQMASMTMFSQCAECGGKEGGGCCSAYMAGETDGILVLINLLLGLDIRFQRDDDFECVYLGQNGCIFKAKPMFCLNYNCRAIYDVNPPEEMVRLDKAAGNVLRQQYKIEQLLLHRLGLR